MQDLQTLFLEAANLRKAGDAPAARDRFASLLQHFPDCHEALYMHGMLCAELGDSSTAESRLRKALTLDAGNPEYLFRLGAVLLAQGKVDEAAETLLDAEREAEENAPLLLAIGSACLQAGRHDEAERAYRRAIELAPGAPEPTMGLLSTLAASRRMDDAVALGKNAAEQHPGRADVLGRVAQILERANRVDDAAAIASRALDINPDEPTALGVHATILKRRDKKEDSVPVFERAISLTQLRQERRDLSRALGLTLDEIGRHDDAYRRFLDSKRPESDMPASSIQFARDAERYIEACRRDLTPGVTATWKNPPPDRRESPIFFVGFPRSGTTLLEQVLGAHPRLVTTDEIESIGRCTEWIVARAGRIDAAPAAYGSLADADILALREMYWKKIEDELGAAALAGRRLVDKHPMNTANLFTARRLFPASKVIVSLRDPRDVILSCFMHLSRTPMAVVYFRDLESAARLYARMMGLWFHMRTALGLPWLEVRYEDLVDDAEATARRVLDFLGEPWDDSVLKFTEKAKKKTIISTSYQQVSQPIYTRAKGRWRAYEKHYGKALAILEPFVQALGYGDR